MRDSIVRGPRVNQTAAVLEFESEPPAEVIPPHREVHDAIAVQIGRARQLRRHAIPDVVLERRQAGAGVPRFDATRDR